MGYGDDLMITSLAKETKEKYPDRQIVIGNQDIGKAYKSIIYKNNPNITDSSDIEFVFPGDFNLDSDVNILDLVGAIQHIIYGIPASDLALAGADYNYDGAVNILDLVATIQFIIFG